jgi:hypothetical protein
LYSIYILDHNMAKMQKPKTESPFEESTNPFDSPIDELVHESGPGASAITVSNRPTSARLEKVLYPPRITLRRAAGQFSQSEGSPPAHRLPKQHLLAPALYDPSNDPIHKLPRPRVLEQVPV